MHNWVIYIICIIRLLYIICNTYNIICNYMHNIYNLILEKAMATQSSTLAWKIPWMEEPGGLQSMGSRTVRHD